MHIHKSNSAWNTFDLIINIVSTKTVSHNIFKRYKQQTYCLQNIYNFIFFKNTQLKVFDFDLQNTIFFILKFSLFLIRKKRDSAII